MSKEIWKDVPEYEGYYKVSNLGRLKRLDRHVTFIDGRERLYKEKIFEVSIVNGYRQTALTVRGVPRTFGVAQIVAMAFLNHKPNGFKKVVDHINGNKLDDRLTNLRIVTNRENSSTCFHSNKSSFSSQYVGVSWNKQSSKWRSSIRHGNIRINLGSFINEKDASNAYQSALSKIKDGSINSNDYKPKWTSKYKGVGFNKKDKMWMARITVDGKLKYIGSYKTEIEAHEAYKQFKQTRHENKIQN